jgi:hypothetical protein
MNAEEQAPLEARAAAAALPEHISQNIAQTDPAQVLATLKRRDQTRERPSEP